MSAGTTCGQRLRARELRRLRLNAEGLALVPVARLPGNAPDLVLGWGSDLARAPEWGWDNAPGLVPEWDSAAGQVREWARVQVPVNDRALVRDSGPDLDQVSAVVLVPVSGEARASSFSNGDRVDGMIGVMTEVLLRNRLREPVPLRRDWPSAKAPPLLSCVRRL